MAIEQQVTVQELSRLNEAINTTLECIRRVAPQLAMLQSHTVTQNPYGAQPFIGAQFGAQLGTPSFANPYQVGLPANSPWIDPVSAAFVQGHIQALRQIIAQPLSVPGAGITAQPQHWTVPQYGMQSPFAGYGQRTF